MCHAAAEFLPARGGLRCDARCAELTGKRTEPAKPAKRRTWGSVEAPNTIQTERTSGKQRNFFFFSCLLIFQASGVYETESDAPAQGQQALGTNSLGSDGRSSDSAKSPV